MEAAAALTQFTSGTVTVDGVELDFDEYGAGEDTVILLPALLMSRKLQAPLARSLALRSIRVICLEHLGERVDGSRHENWHYSSERLGAQLVGAMDELGVKRAVIGGTSIAASVSLEAALAAPKRVSGLILEGPFLDDGVAAVQLVWSGLVGLYTVGRPALRALGFFASLIPSGADDRLDLLREALIQDPARAAAYLQGLSFSRMGPPRGERAAITAPALVLGVPLDPLHPMSDARALVDELPDARLIRARSLAELRLRPERLAGELARFVGDCRRDARKPKLAVA